MLLPDLGWALFFPYWLTINEQWKLIFKMGPINQAYFYQDRLIAMLVNLFNSFANFNLDDLFIVL